MVNIFLIAFFMMGACSDGDNPIPESPQPGKQIEITLAPEPGEFSGEGETKSVIVTANADWAVTSSQSWCTLSVAKGYPGQTSLKITVLKNPFETPRTAKLTFIAGDDFTKKVTITQRKGQQENYVPEGYNLVWSDEFNDPRENDGKPSMPSTEKWWFETGASGWGNNELQNYIDRFIGTDTCAVVTDGTLKIIAKKKGSEVISIRMNTIESWQYGYFEARLRMPSGKGTWPAFWMLPKDFKSWPLDGEIDIMEYVGYDPNV
ncbi:MAG: family 16 glycosylhydrolase, partial [Bacteroidales bacterium]|nr:family 16 glycosylhydrolase [Bacteroidales bacterium]